MTLIKQRFSPTDLNVKILICQGIKREKYYFEEHVPCLRTCSRRTYN